MGKQEVCSAEAGTLVPVLKKNQPQRLNSNPNYLDAKTLLATYLPSQKSSN